jgi:hypothetical protein
MKRPKYIAKYLRTILERLKWQGCQRCDLEPSICAFDCTISERRCIHHIATELQIADMLTKPQPVELFVNQRYILMKWPPSEAPSFSQPNHLRACGIIVVSMMSLDEMPRTLHYTPPSKGMRKQQKRAGIMNYGNKRKATEMEKMPRMEGHRTRVHWEVKPS